MACGRETPLKGNHAFPNDWRQGADNLLGLTLPKGQNTVSNLDAVELLTSTIQSSSQKVTLLALGPLTNIADAVQSSPSLVDNVEMIYIMGGAINVPGNIAVTGVGIDNQVAEWNIYVDPFAANVVFRSRAPITLVPLDATNYVPLTTDFYERLKASHVTPEANFLFDLYTNNFWLFAGRNYFWDQLTAAILTDAGLATYQTLNLCVIEDEGPESGRTVVRENCPKMRIAVSADRIKFETLFLETLNNKSPTTTSITPPPTDAPPSMATKKPAIQSTVVSPIATQAPTNADAIAGTWSGTAKNEDFTFRITVTIGKSCTIGSLCGSFDIPTIPCSGTFTLIDIKENIYQFQADNFKGACVSGAADFLQLLPDGTLLYISRHPSYGESKGVLVKVGN